MGSVRTAENILCSTAERWWHVTGKHCSQLAALGGAQPRDSTSLHLWMQVTIQCNKGKLSFVAKDLSAKLTDDVPSWIFFWLYSVLSVTNESGLFVFLGMPITRSNTNILPCLILLFFYPRRFIFSTWLFWKETYTASLCWDTAIRKATPLPWSPEIEEITCVSATLPVSQPFSMLTEHLLLMPQNASCYPGPL